MKRYQIYKNLRNGSWITYLYGWMLKTLTSFGRNYLIQRSISWPLINGKHWELVPVIAEHHSATLTRKLTLDGSISKERARSEWNYGASLKLERENWKSKVADERNEEVQETKQRKGSQNLKFRVVSDDA